MSQMSQDPLSFAERITFKRVSEFYDGFLARGVVVSVVDGHTLGVEAPQGAVTDADKRILEEFKPEFIRYLVRRRNVKNRVQEGLEKVQADPRYDWTSETEESTAAGKVLDDAMYNFIAGVVGWDDVNAAFQHYCRKHKVQG